LKDVMMTERSNAQWIADLTADPATRDAALTDLASEEITHMAEDFAQDATLRVLENLESFRGDSQFTTWAMKVGVRIAITELRRSHYRDYSLDTLTESGDLQTSASPMLNSSTPDRPEAATEKQDVLQKIDAAFNDALTDRGRRSNC
jgi:RNA polymerase sigma-70 factor (ECF subfamily)